MERITLDSPLTIRNAFLYPVQNKAARRDVLIGSAWLLVPGIGWVMNMGHRIAATHNALRGDEPWPAWTTPGIFRHGLWTLLGMIVYHMPATLVGIAARETGSRELWVLAGMLWVLATCMVPGYMTRYCVAFDARVIFQFRESVSSVFRSGSAYWHSWAMVLVLLGASFLGLLGFGIAFLLTSVWFWQSAAFCFASTMKRALEIDSAQ